MPASALIYHDTRRVKKTGLYPVKLRVYYNAEKKRYPLNIDLSEDDFAKSYLTAIPKGKNPKDTKRLTDLQGRIKAIELKARGIIEKLEPFNWVKFEKAMFRQASSVGNVYYYYDQVIKKLLAEDRIGTASNYELSKKSIKAFVNRDLSKEAIKEAIKDETAYLSFTEIDVDFLNKYERWMVKEGRELTTVGIYLRPLRALFNLAIEAEEINKDIYPFKKGRYTIPAGSNVKKALNKATLQTLFNYVTDDENIIKARSFWFFSFLCNGINMRDICELQYKNLAAGAIHFVRTKTKRTTKGRQEVLTAALTPLAEEVIKRYGSPKRNGETYVFPIHNHLMAAEEKHRATQVFTRYVNQHMERLAKMAGIDQPVSTYAARHTFSTLSVRNGATVEFIQKALGHGSITTTQNYLASLDTETIKKNTDQLLNQLMN